MSLRKYVGIYKHTLTLLCLSVLVFILFGGTISHRFNSDDYLVLYHAIHRSAATPAEGLAEFLKPSWGLYYRPGIKVFFEVLAKSFGLWSGGYHTVSLICYTLLCLEIYLIGLLLTERWLVALAAAIIFMTSSVHGEAIFWISSLNGVVENLLTLASLACFVWWRRGCKRFPYFLSLVFFASALFVKESAMSLPLILIVYDILLGGEALWPAAPKRAAKSCWPFVLLGISFVLLRHAIMKQVQLPPSLTTFDMRILTIGLWYSLIMTLSPVDWALALHWFEKLRVSGILFHLSAVIGILTVAVIPLVIRKFRMTFLLWWILASAAPILALGLVPSERHTVFGSAGAALLVSIALFRSAGWIVRKPGTYSIMLGCVLAAAFSASGCYFLKQRQAIWKHASEVANNLVEQTVSIYPIPARNTTFFFLNVPDSIDGALIFRFENLAYALRLFYGDDSIDVIRIVTPERVPSGALSNAKAAYFRIAAMGGHIHVPRQYSQSPQLAAGWQKIERLQILTEDVRYLRNWDRYSVSPFLIYAGGALIPAPSEELIAILQELYSLK
ncbi:MAG: hypothetical protein JSV16_05975 [Candidatus Hydrogenedentota bacterium]|nr:MAG: hypothetical protein JSV16_05975 [Candidatus Hydrogenedentota bacterium]